MRRKATTRRVQCGVEGPYVAQAQQTASRSTAVRRPSNSRSVSLDRLIAMTHPSWSLRNAKDRFSAVGDSRWLVSRSSSPGRASARPSGRGTSSSDPFLPRHGRALVTAASASWPRSPDAFAHPASTFSASHALISDWYGTSRLFAATLIRSRRLTGIRSEIAVVDGFRFGRRTRSARLQSTWSVESWLSQ